MASFVKPFKINFNFLWVVGFFIEYNKNILSVESKS